MWKKILRALVIAVAIVLGLIAVQPSTYTVRRSATIAAPPQVIALGVKANAAGSAVSWNMTGQSNFARKAVSLFSSMDKIVGPDFERVWHS